MKGIMWMDNVMAMAFMYSKMEMCKREKKQEIFPKMIINFCYCNNL